MKKILAIDDERLMTNMIKVIMEDRGHSVTGFSNPLEGENEAIKNSYDFIFLDLHMAERNGNHITKNILAAKPDSKIIIMTAFPTDPMALDALREGAVSIVAKPLNLEKVLNLINNMEEN